VFSLEDHLIAEPENHTLHLLREIRASIGALDSKMDGKITALDGKITALDNKIGRNHEELQKRIDSLRQAMLGESVLGRYATAEFDERFAALEQRVSVLESRR
jgi:uncharacterized small protein (DUF1192 family)